MTDTDNPNLFFSDNDSADSMIDLSKPMEGAPSYRKESFIKGLASTGKKNKEMLLEEELR